MTIELRMLAFAILLGVIQLIAATQAATKQRGTEWNLSSRDEKPPELTGKAGRLDRAFKNFMETFPFFAAAVLAVHVTNRLTMWTAIGAELYLVCRVLYVPIYVMGIRVVRTGIWTLSMIGFVLVLWPLLWPF